jgi:exoribonuclease-2
VQLFSIISAFDAAHAEYNAFQSGIERYWTLQYLAQRQIETLNATVMKDGLVRADDLPLVFRAVGAESLPRGAHVRTRVGAADLLTLDVKASVVDRLDDRAAATAAPDAIDDAADAADAEETLEAAGPLTLAIATEDEQAALAADADRAASAA